MFGVISLIAVVLLFIKMNSMGDRISFLERSLNKSLSLERMQAKQRPHQTEPQDAHMAVPVAADTPSVVSEVGVAPTQVSDTPPTSDRFNAWIKQDWMLKVGAFLLLLGVGWLVSYAFINNWIGPVGRVTFGVVLGAAFMGFGFWYMRRVKHIGAIFLALGTAMVLASIFSARHWFGLFTPVSATLMMFLATVVVAVASVKHKSRELAYTSLVLASIVPFLVRSGDDNFVALFAYLLIVTVVMIMVALKTRWLDVLAASGIVFAAYSGLCFLEDPNLSQFDQASLLTIAYAFIAVFFASHLFIYLKNLNASEFIKGIQAAMGVALLIVGWTIYALDKPAEQMVLVLWTVVLLAGGFMCTRVCGREHAWLTYASASLVPLVAATLGYFEGPVLSIALTIEAVLIPVLVQRVAQSPLTASRWSWVMLVPGVFSLDAFIELLDGGARWGDEALIALVVVLGFFVLGAFFYNLYKTHHHKEVKTTTTVLWIIASLGLYALIWFATHEWFRDSDMAIVVALVVYTIIGLVTHIKGKKDAMPVLKLYGAILLGAVIARLLLIDVWNMDLAERIITFFLIGGLLMSTSFIGRKALLTQADQEDH